MRVACLTAVYVDLKGGKANIKRWRCFQCNQRPQHGQPHPWCKLDLVHWAADWGPNRGAANRPLPISLSFHCCGWCWPLCGLFKSIKAGNVGCIPSMSGMTCFGQRVSLEKHCVFTLSPNPQSAAICFPHLPPSVALKEPIGKGSRLPFSSAWAL